MNNDDMAKKIKHMMQVIDELSMAVEGMSEKLRQHNNCLKILLMNDKRGNMSNDIPSKL